LQNLKARELALAFFVIHSEKKKQLACVRQKIVTETYGVNRQRDLVVVEDLANKHIKGLLYFWHKQCHS